MQLLHRHSSNQANRRTKETSIIHFMTGFDDDYDIQAALNQQVRIVI